MTGDRLTRAGAAAAVLVVAAIAAVVSFVHIEHLALTPAPGPPAGVTLNGGKPRREVTHG